MNRKFFVLSKITKKNEIKDSLKVFFHKTGRSVKFTIGIHSSLWNK